MDKSKIKKIFLSHSYPDRKISDRIIEKIIVPIFNIDKHQDIFYTGKRETGIRSGVNWKNKIKTNLKNCDIFIALITANYKKSEMCIGELGAAWVQDKKIYILILPPIKYENSSVILSEIQADILINRKNIKSFVDSLSIDLKQFYNIVLTQDIDIDEYIFKFIRSVKQYLKKNPHLFTVEDKLPELENKLISKLKKKGKKLEPIVDIKKNELEKELIIKRSKVEWPDDYSMQEYYINEQTEALINFHKLQNEVKSIPEKINILKKAESEWPKDYAMQLYHANEQIEALKNLQKLKKKVITPVTEKEHSDKGRIHLSINNLLGEYNGIFGIAIGVNITNTNREHRYFNEPTFKLTNPIEEFGNALYFTEQIMPVDFPNKLEFGQVVSVNYNIKLRALRDIWEKLPPDTQLYAVVTTTLGEKYKSNMIEVSDLVNALRRLDK